MMLLFATGMSSKVLMLRGRLHLSLCWEALHGEQQATFIHQCSAFIKIKWSKPSCRLPQGWWAVVVELNVQELIALGPVVGAPGLRGQWRNICISCQGDVVLPILRTKS